MKTLTIAIGFPALVAMAGCTSLTSEPTSVDYKGTGSSRAPTLEIPPDLSPATAGDPYVVPEDGDAQPGTNYSDYAKSGGGDAAKGIKPVPPQVLPATPGVHMTENGGQRWLVVDDTPENIWPKIMEFFPENGLPIKTSNPQAGIIETDWVENRAKLPKSGITGFFGKPFGGVDTSGQKDMYRVRLEHAQDGRGTEIHLAQHGMEQALDADKKEFHWVERRSDPDVEAAMLQMLAAKLAGVAGAPPVSAAAQIEAAAPPPQLKQRPDGTQVIVMNQAFDKSWRDVGLALEREKFPVTDKNRMRGIYYINGQAAQEKSWLSKLAFWSSDSSTSKVQERYQVRVYERGSGCEMSVESGEEDGGANAAGIARVTEILFKALSPAK